MIQQALGYVHGAQVVHAPEPVHGRLRYMICVLSVHVFFLLFFYGVTLTNDHLKQKILCH